MGRKPGFDNERYLEEQTKAILEKVGQFGNKLYLEFGGKIVFGYHAARVLPGFDPNVKMRLLKKLKDKAEIILCIYAGDIERRKVFSDAVPDIDDLCFFQVRKCAAAALYVERQRLDGRTAPGAAGHGCAVKVQ